MNLSCVYINSMVCMEKFRDGVNHMDCVSAAPSIYTMFGLSSSKHVHSLIFTYAVKDHGGMLLSWGALLLVPTFVSVMFVCTIGVS